MYQGLVTGEFFQIEGDRCWCHMSSLLMSNSCLWGGLNCRTWQFPHPSGNLSPVIYCYQTLDAWQVTSWENMTYTTSTVDSTFRRRIQWCVETLWWLATGRNWLEKWRSSLMLLTIQTTTACTSNISFNSALIVYSASKAFLGCIWEGVCRLWSRWCHWVWVAVHQPLLTSKQGIVDIQMDSSSPNC